MISENEVNGIIQLIDQRFDDVMAANNIEASEENFQYVWIRGIYSDIKEYLKVSLQQYSGE